MRCDDWRLVCILCQHDQRAADDVHHRIHLLRFFNDPFYLKQPWNIQHSISFAWRGLRCPTVISRLLYEFSRKRPYGSTHLQNVFGPQYLKMCIFASIPFHLLIFDLRFIHCSPLKHGIRFWILRLHFKLCLAVLKVDCNIMPCTPCQSKNLVTD